MEQASVTSHSPNPRPSYGKELCLLSLDGGGVRGLSSLQIIKQIMETINPENPPKPCDYFDMIGGASTGGLIALMLGRLRMSIDDCIAAYTDLSPKIFTKLHHRLSWPGRIQGRFDHQALENGVKSLLVQQGLGEDALLKDPSSVACKTFVCASSKQTTNTVVLSSYFSKRRGTDMLNITKIWEAARATSAASSFFDPIEIGDEEFVDGATRSNNPVNAIWTEAFDTWRDSEEWKLEENVKCLVSIGTGIPSLKPFGDDLISIGKTLIAIATDTEAQAESFQRQHTMMNKEHRYFRFNVLRGLENIGLEEASKYKEIRAATRDYIQTETVFNQLEACAQNLDERESLRRLVEVARRNTERTWQSLKAPHAGKGDQPDTNSLAWFTNTSDYDWWLQSGGSILWYPISPLTSRLVHNSLGASLSMQLLEQSKNGQGPKLDIMYHRCGPHLQARSDRNQDALGVSSELTSVLWSFINQALVAGHDTHADIQARVYKLKPSDRLLLRRGPATAAHISLQLLIKLLCSVRQLKANPATIFVIDNFHDVERSGTVETLTKLRQMLDMSPNIHVLITGTATEALKGAVNEFRIFVEDAERTECLRSLFFEGLQARRDQVAHAVDGTNSWIWSHRSYLAWEHEPSSILWIQGKPGSGKSVLAKSIQRRLSSIHQRDASTVQNMLLTKSNRSSIVGDWFYSSRGGTVGISHISMLRSILHQLLEQDLSLFRYYKEIYRKRRHRGTGHCPWSKDDFQAIFSRIAAAGDDVPQILSVVDGLDESEDSLGGGERGDILSFFSNLVNKHSGSRIKIILLSRPARAFEKEFRHCHQIILEHENSDDIKGVVDSGLRSLRMSIQSFDSSDEESPDTVQRTITKRVGTSRMNQKKGNPPSKNRRLNSCFNQVKDSEQGELNFIRAYLLKHAQGVILWVTLIITELKHHVEKGMYTFIELKELLFHLPLDLDTVYRRIIHDLEQKQDKAEQAKARRILAWVSGASAKQPLQLKEILDALAVPSDLEAALKSVDDPILANRPRFRSWNHFRRSLYEFCGPLVEVIRPTAVARIHLTDESNVDTIDETINDFWDVGPTSVVQLLHQTVKDFLANPKVAHGFSFQPLEAERMVDDDLQKYLKLSLPVIPTPYVPMLEVEASGLEMNVEAVVSYLEGKYLLPFVLNNFPITPQYPLFDYLRAYSPLRRLLSASAIDWRNENTDDPVKNVRNNPLSRYFWLACRQGFVTAVDNMLIMMMILQPRWYSKEAVIQGALLAAIEHRLLHLVRDLLVFCYDVSALLPEAAKTGDEEITMLLYDRWRNKRTDHQGRSWWLARARESSRSSEFDDSMIDDVKEAIERVMLSYRSLRNQ